MGAGGPVSLITLPCPALTTEVVMRPGAMALHHAGHPALSRARAAALLARLGLARRGRFLLRSGMVPGGGAGASTAALVALARAAGAWQPPEAILRACVAVEGASDPLGLDRAERLLWASRQARIVARMPPLPAFDVLGGFRGPPRTTDPRDNDFPDIADLVAAWPDACADPPALARLVSESARRTLTRRGPAGDPTAALAARLGALGWAIAHTGSARALLFAPGTCPEAAPADLRAAGFCRITRFRIGG